jgi:hypothetical protein
MRPCGECTACCTWLHGDAYGHEFGNGTSCKFLCEGCSIHKVRPSACVNYQCGWSQYLIDEELRPDKCGIIISVENNQEGQYLKAILFDKDKINNSTISYLDDWSKKMNTPIVYVDKRDN